MAENAPIIVRGNADQAVELPIAQGPPTGYGWVLDLPAGVVQLADAPGKPPEPGKALGSSARGPLRVKAPKGEYSISARFVRPWEPNKPLRTIVIDLIIE